MKLKKSRYQFDQQFVILNFLKLISFFITNYTDISLYNLRCNNFAVAVVMLLHIWTTYNVRQNSIFAKLLINYWQNLIASKEKLYRT